MKRKTLERLACPACRGKLFLREAGGNDTVETGTLVCAGCQRQYPIKEGIVIGGINFFGDKQAAIDEMIRVARPGTKDRHCRRERKGSQGVRLAPWLQAAV